MKIFIFCVFIFFILPNFVLGQNNKHFNLFDAVKFIYKDRDMHHEICDSLPRLSADDRHWFAEEHFPSCNQPPRAQNRDTVTRCSS